MTIKALVKNEWVRKIPNPNVYLKLGSPERSYFTFKLTKFIWHGLIWSIYWCAWLNKKMKQFLNSFLNNYLVFSPFLSREHRFSKISVRGN